jgi:hypothetical protein
VALRNVLVEVESGAPLDPALEDCLRRQTAEDLASESPAGAHPDLEDGYEYFVIFGGRGPSPASAPPPSRQEAKP